jgi:type 1 glutamine amidotransferase
MTLSRRAFLGTAAVAVASPGLAQPPKPKKLVLMAGTPSHGPGDHEFNAGVMLLADCLKGVRGLDAVVLRNGYPADDSVLDTADGILCYADGGAGHPLIRDQRLTRIGTLMNKGVGLMCCHFAVEVPKDLGGPDFQNWIGGYYETRYSCNPFWTPEYREFPDHPIARGVKPFAVRDEWYFNMRFRDDGKGITPILSARPPDAVRDGPYVAPRGPYKHVQEAKGRTEHMMWAVERAGGGRGVGFTGGHVHRNWIDPNFRKVILNALLWVSKVAVPETGVESTVSEEEIGRNLDPKPMRR